MAKRDPYIYLFLLILLFIFNPCILPAAEFTVNSNVDTIDILPGDGICADSSGNCTLRAAIMEANALSGEDSITLPAGTFTLTIPTTYEDMALNGDLDIITGETVFSQTPDADNRLSEVESNSLTITGAGTDVTIIDGGRIDRVFHLMFEIIDDMQEFSNPATKENLRSISPAGTVTITDLTIQNGYRDENCCGEDDGVSGGGVKNRTNAVLKRCIIQNNEATYGIGTGSGGGVSNGSYYFYLEDSGANDRSENIAIPGILRLEQCAVVNNTCNDAGGGIKNGYGELTLINCTISGNHSDDYTGGVHTGCDATTGFTYCTVANNTSNCTDDCRHAAGISGNGTVYLQNTIVADNVNNGICDDSIEGENLRGDDDGCSLGGGANDCSGKFRSLGYNLIENPGSYFCIVDDSIMGADCNPADNSFSPVASDQIGDDPKLGPLADNGGATLTHALLAGSPALNQIPCSANPAAGLRSPALLIDQRGFVRPQPENGLCDIGAFEAVSDDGDGIDPGIENGAPNGGDGNGDGNDDSSQSNVASLVGSDGSYVTVEITDGCGQLLNLGTQTEASQGDDPEFDYPHGLVSFEIPCESATVRIYFHGATDLFDSTYRKFGPTTPGDPGSAAWYTLPGVTFGSEEIGGANVPYAEFTLYDNQLGDDTGDDGVIVDSGGPGNRNASIPTLNEWGMIIFSLLLLGSAIYCRQREFS